MKRGLVMEGGAMRGMFSAGVTDVMMENNIEYDGAIGVSAGAAFGCNYKSGQIGRAIRYNMQFCNDKRYCSFRSLITSGNLYNTEFCYHVVPETIDIFDKAAYRENPMEFYVVCTDVTTGKAIYHNLMDADDFGFDWIRASASMPMVSKVVEVGGYQLLDGGISDSIPLKAFEEMGYNRNVVILTQPDDYVKKPNNLMLPVKIMLRRYPQMVKAIKNRHVMYNETLEYIRKKEKSGEILVIRPKEKLPVGRIEHNPEKLCEAYEIGRKICLDRLDEIKEFLMKNEL